MNGILLVLMLLQTPADSAPKDTQPRVVSRCFELCPALAIAAVGAITLAAPSAFLLAKGTEWQNGPRVGFSNLHVIAYVTGGMSSEMPGNGSSQGGELNVLTGRRHLYGSVRVEHLYTQKFGAYRYESAEVGYLVHPWPSAMGGITVGYRRAHGDSAQNAVQLGFPLIAGRDKLWIRAEPIYLFSSAGISWTYRFQFDVAVARTPLVVGYYLEVKPPRQGREYFVMPALVLGMRF